MLINLAAIAANAGSDSRGSLNDAVTVAQLHSVADALLSLVSSEASLLDELLLKDTVLPDVVLDLHGKQICSGDGGQDNADLDCSREQPET